jgi:hypothetical protein
MFVGEAHRLKFTGSTEVCEEPGRTVSIVSGYGLDERAI